MQKQNALSRRTKRISPVFFGMIVTAALAFGNDCSADIVRFEEDATLFDFAAYSEAGYTITKTASRVNIEDAGVADDGRMVFRTFTNLRPGAVLTNDNNDLFSIESLDVDEYITGSSFPRGFFIDASSGASHRFTGTGHVDFSGIAGDWTNLTSVTFRYEGASSTESFGVDNIELTAVPEPASGIVLLACIPLAMIYRRRKGATFE